MIIENECWKDVDCCSYCVEYYNENNKYNIYRIGGVGNDNKIAKFIKTKRIYCEKFGLFTIGGTQDN